jgi:hypothetical protein
MNIYERWALNEAEVYLDQLRDALAVGDHVEAAYLRGILTRTLGRLPESAAKQRLAAQADRFDRR